MADRLGSTECKECRAIAREVAEAMADAWISSDEQTQKAWLAVRKMIGGTEEDAERAEELAGKFSSGDPQRIHDGFYGKPGAYYVARSNVRDPHRVHRAIIKRFAHEARTGHKVPRGPEDE